MQLRAKRVVAVLKSRHLCVCLACGASTALLLLTAPQRVRQHAERVAQAASFESGSWQQQCLPADPPAARVNASLLAVLPYEPFGFQFNEEASAARYGRRWAMVRASLVHLLGSWHAAEGAGTDVAAEVLRPYRTMEWRADQGYLSAGLLVALPRARVLSVDPDTAAPNDYPLTYYKKRLGQAPFKDGHRDRAVLCRSRLTSHAIARLAPRGPLCPAAGSAAHAVHAAVHLQLTPGGLEGLRAGNRTAFMQTLARHVRAARATIIELPEPNDATDAEPAARWLVGDGGAVAAVQRGLDEHLCEAEASEPCLLRADVRRLGANLTEYGLRPAPPQRAVLLVALACAEGAAFAVPQVEAPSAAACARWLEAAGCPSDRLLHGACTDAPSMS